MHPGFAAIQPWIEHLGDPPELPSLAQLNSWQGSAGPRFAAPAASATPYELQIAEQNCVPTRPDSWHDAFNALCWLAWPLTKRAINRSHCAIIRAGGATELRQRSPARDALTLLDEAGAIVLSSDPELFDALRRGDWQRLFVDCRTRVQNHARLLLLGHAVLDELRQPRLNSTCKCLLFEVDAEVLGLPDTELRGVADALAAERLGRHEELGKGRQYPPLPIMGWPGWHPDNDRGGFYAANPDVFRTRNPHALEDTF